MDQTPERWAAIPGYEGLYEASTHGRVRSPICVRKPQRHGDTGYLHLVLSKDGHKRTHLLHHLILLAFVSARPPGLECRHLNGDPTDNRLANLKWGTPQENQADVEAHGRRVQTKRTHCPYGHHLGHPNLIQSHLARGKRSCLSCNRARAYARGAGIPFTQALADSYYARL